MNLNLLRSFVFVDVRHLRMFDLKIVVVLFKLKKEHFLEVVFIASQFQVKLRLLVIIVFVNANLLKKSSFLMILNFVVLVNLYFVEVVLRRSEFQVKLNLFQVMHLHVVILSVSR